MKQSFGRENFVGFRSVVQVKIFNQTEITLKRLQMTFSDLFQVVLFRTFYKYYKLLRLKYICTVFGSMVYFIHR